MKVVILPEARVGIQLFRSFPEVCAKSGIEVSFLADFLYKKLLVLEFQGFWTLSIICFPKKHKMSGK
jgi:hypothetical protein